MGVHPQSTIPSIADGDFHERVAVVTGGAAGMGRAFCAELARRGCLVAVLDDDAHRAASTVEDLASGGSIAMAVTCDVADEDQVRSAVASVVDRYGRLDILINNAGRHLMRFSRPFGELPHSDLRQLFDVNVFGVINCTLAARPALKASGAGRIVNISSASGYRVLNPYGVTKLAVRGLTSAFAHELASDGIRVNAIAPGLIMTGNVTADLPADVVTNYQSGQLIRRAGTAQDIVNAMTFLCSSDSAFITGETIRVTGGHSVHV